jgi:hypothetical protein
MKTSIKLGRPTAFDKDAALDVAMRLFWSRGYEGRSMETYLRRWAFTRPAFTPPLVTNGRSSRLPPNGTLTSL